MIICLIQGALTLVFSFLLRQPISIVWSTPAAALMIATGVPNGGYPAAVGAMLFAAVLIVVAGLWKPFGRAVGAIPKALASAMLAGILFGLCLAPVRAMAEIPLYAAPIVIAWVLAWRFARPYAVPIALVVTCLIVIFVTKLPPGALSNAWPHLSFTAPGLSWSTLGSLGLPLFVVTMASQNVPGLAVLRANGFRPEVGPIFLATGARLDCFGAVRRKPAEPGRRHGGALRRPGRPSRPGEALLVDGGQRARLPRAWPCGRPCGGARGCRRRPC